MFSTKSRLLLATAAIVAVTACDNSPTDPGLDGPDDAAVEGRVEQTTPNSGASGAPQQAPGAGAQTVSVVRIAASGAYHELASADVRADGSYRVEGVPSGASNTAVVAYVDGRVAGERENDSRRTDHLRDHHGDANVREDPGIRPRPPDLDQ